MTTETPAYRLPLRLNGPKCRLAMVCRCLEMRLPTAVAGIRC
jgi:tRNA pseudouridine-54 N-methylase